MFQNCIFRLQILYLGGNHLQHLPEEMGECRDLQSLILCDNRLSVLPHSLSRLHKLQSLSLHSNRLSTLPPGIVNLQLVELSLRNNPLVVSYSTVIYLNYTNIDLVLRREEAVCHKGCSRKKPGEGENISFRILSRI